jgi:superfamily I DNA/RNA helicase
MSLKAAARLAVADRVLTPKLYNSLKALLALLDDIRDLSPAEAIRRVIARTGYLDHLENYTRRNSMDFTARQENIDQLIHAASQKETIADYLEEAALVREDKDEDEDATGVNLSTVHWRQGAGVSHGFCHRLRRGSVSPLAIHRASRRSRGGTAADVCGRDAGRAVSVSHFGRVP